MTNKSTKSGRGRPCKFESYADWMARIDAEVDQMTRELPKETSSVPIRPPSSREGRLFYALSEVRKIEERLWTMLQKERYAARATQDAEDDD